ncbi:MAG: 1-acyl-sn-glycerol-3-phosphate acyltransferase [Lachnospiraceae bacterium]|nr:1-acyl-sn-glycerol-3-phosphate acyltransferase [Lachnospiraceae bacterium]
MLRIFFAGLYVVLFLILTMPFMLVGWILKKIAPKTGDRFCLAVVNWGFRCVLRICGTDITVIGHDRIPRDTPVLYVGNHRSIFDIVLTYPLVVGPTGYLSKIENAKVPLLNIWMKLLHCLFLDRSTARTGLQTILDAIELEKNGVSIAVFPEGTRNKDPESDDLLPLHNGSFKIATKSGVPIQPMTINGAEQIFEAHKPFIRKCRVIIEYGDPIRLETLSKEELKNIGDYVGKILRDTYVKNKPLLEQSASAK